MKTIGIVGGVAWPSTVVYYQTINRLVAEQLGDSGLHCAKLVIAQTDFHDIERSQRESRWDTVGDLLAAEGNKLKAAGADFFLVACNTVHTAEHIGPSVDLPFIHIVDPAGKLAKDRGHRKVGLLGSRYTMNGDYFVGRLTDKFGLEVLVAQGEHEDNVHNALYEELARGVFLPETRNKFRAAIQDLVDRGAETIVLGCTEFGMLVDQTDSPVPLIDTTIAHAEAAAEFALSDSPTSELAVNVYQPQATSVAQ